MWLLPTVILLKEWMFDTRHHVKDDVENEERDVES